MGKKEEAMRQLEVQTIQDEVQDKTYAASPSEVVRVGSPSFSMKIPIAITVVLIVILIGLIFVIPKICFLWQCR